MFHALGWKLLLLLGDLAAYCLAVLTSLSVNPKVETSLWEFVGYHYLKIILVGATYLAVFYVVDLYNYLRDYRRWSNIAEVILSVWVATLAVILTYYFPLGAFIGRTLLVLQAAVFMVLLVAWRWTFSAIALPQRLKRPTIIVGTGEAGKSILAAIRRGPGCGLEVVGFINADPKKTGTEVADVPVLGDYARLQEVVRQHQVSLVVAATAPEESPVLTYALTQLSWSGCQVTDMPSLYESLTGQVTIEHIPDIWLYLHSLQTNRLYFQHLKPLLDRVLAALGLALTWPLFVLIALAIKLDSPGPAFFRQKRLGQDGRPFKIIKFRTMGAGAEENGPQWAQADDPRVTRVGRILRQTGLDELPQLLNILRGDMSFVGPRPEQEVFVEEFRKPVAPGPQEAIPGHQETIPYYSYRLLVKPGLTGWAQVMYPYASSLPESREKLKYDLYYIKNMGFFMDLAVLLKTLRILLFGQKPAHPSKPGETYDG